MEYEQMTVMLVNDSQMQAKAEQLRAEGWEIRADVPPVTIYNLVRPKPSMGFAKATLTIDENKVFIRSPDGTIRKN